MEQPLHVGRRHVSFDDVVADHGGVARPGPLRDAVLCLDGIHVLDVGYRRREAGLAQVLDPQRATTAGRVLVDLNRRATLRKAPQPRGHDHATENAEQLAALETRFSWLLPFSRLCLLPFAL